MLAVVPLVLFASKMWKDSHQVGVEVEVVPTVTRDAAEEMIGFIYNQATHTPTLVPTATPAPTSTPVPEIREATGAYYGLDNDEWELGLARYSYYFPPLGGINCDGDCDHMANGEAWRGYVGEVVACPPEFPLGTVFRVLGDEYICLDRGGAIQFLDDGTFWLDFLRPNGEYPFWTIILVEWRIP